jgi:hypothetical protein
MPSVTWGVIQGRKERLVTRVLALDFLRSVGVTDPAGELEAVELPSSLDVLQERLDFLLRLGPNYPLLLACSLRKNVIPVLSYLEKLDVTRARLAAFVRAYPACLHASVAVDRMDIPRVLEQYLDILGLKPDGTIRTSDAYLVGIVDPAGTSSATMRGGGGGGANGPAATATLSPAGASSATMTGRGGADSIDAAPPAEGTALPPPPARQAPPSDRTTSAKHGPDGGAVAAIDSGGSGGIVPSNEGDGVSSMFSTAFDWTGLQLDEEQQRKGTLVRAAPLIPIKGGTMLSRQAKH